MDAQALLREGKIDEAIEAAGARLRDDPANVRLRTMLFELLCFNGEYDRAEKHLAVLSEKSKEAALGALLYRGCLAAERARAERFEKGDDGLSPAPPPVSGELNGQRFASLQDADTRLGARVEMFAAGNYLWIPWQHIARIEMEPPRKLRDTLWAPAKVQAGAGFRGMELGEVLLPVLTPFSHRHPDGHVRLGHVTEWVAENGGEIPYGQKTLLVDGEEIPLLEVRSLTIDQAPGGGDDAAG